MKFNNFTNDNDLYCPVPRGFEKGTFEWQDRFIKFLDHIGCDQYGYIDDQNHPNANYRGGVKTDLFEIKPYYWGDDRIEEDYPNFVYFPTEYKLRWYKYPLRDSYANKNISYKEFKRMLRECEIYWKNKCENNDEYGCWEDNDNSDEEDEEWED